MTPARIGWLQNETAKVADQYCTDAERNVEKIW